MRFFRTSLVVLLALAVCGAAAAADATAQRLFHIERNHNANIVAYDALVLPDSSLRDKDPVEVYWVRLAEEGQRKELKGIEKKLAYGFKVDSRQGNHLVLEMVADVGRTVEVDRHGEVYRAFMIIEGRRTLLDKIYIFAEGSFKPTVKYIELFGKDPETGEARYEKLIP